MILPLFRRNRQDTSIDRLYGAIVAQARQPVFYARYAVPDTVEGRLDMIVLHIVLLLHRLRGDEGRAVQSVGQRVFDRFCVDMDDNLREMGVGDLSVPKVMQRIASTFYGRAKVYEAALEAALGVPDKDDLAAALRRNIYPAGATGSDADEGAGRLAGYVRGAVVHLRGLETARLVGGDLTFPSP